MDSPKFISSNQKEESISIQRVKYEVLKNNVCHHLQGLFQQVWEKAPGQNWEKKIDLTSKLGEINHIEHYKGSKIYPQNQVILDCKMPSIPLKHKCLSIILILVSVSHFFFFFFYFS